MTRLARIIRAQLRLSCHSWRWPRLPEPMVANASAPARLSSSKQLYLDAAPCARIINHLTIQRRRRPGFMNDFRILLKQVRPYAGLFATAFILMSMVAVFEAGRTALLKSIIDVLSGSPHQIGTGL